MRHKRLKLSAVLLLGLGLTGLQAQTSINTAGSKAAGSGGTISYSIGQIDYQTHTGTNGSVAEGVQQPYEISVVNATEETIDIKLSVSVFPNPATDYLTLEVKDTDYSKLRFQLFDMQGKLIKNEKIAGSQTSIAMSNLVPAMYFIKVTQKNKELKSFKIIKK